MKKVFVLASSTLVMAALVLALVLILPAQAKVVENNVNVPFGPLFVNGCSGPVWIEGTGHFLLSHTDDGNEGLHGHLHANLHFTGVDLETGGKYVANEKVRENFNSGPGETHTLETAFKLIGQGKLPDHTFRQTLKVTVNANGEITVIRESFKDECK